MRCIDHDTRLKFYLSGLHVSLKLRRSSMSRVNRHWSRWLHCSGDEGQLARRRLTRIARRRLPKRRTGNHQQPNAKATSKAISHRATPIQHTATPYPRKRQSTTAVDSQFAVGLFSA